MTHVLILFEGEGIHLDGVVASLLGVIPEANPKTRKQVRNEAPDTAQRLFTKSWDGPSLTPKGQLIGLAFRIALL